MNYKKSNHNSIDHKNAESSDNTCLGIKFKKSKNLF